MMNTMNSEQEHNRARRLLLHGIFLSTSALIDAGGRRIVYISNRRNLLLRMLGIPITKGDSPLYIPVGIIIGMAN